MLFQLNKHRPFCVYLTNSSEILVLNPFEIE